MWCKNCNIETNEPTCPICKEATIEDLPVEIFWCSHCKTPIIQVANQADRGTCPLCGQKTKYMSSDLRPVFPEERLLLEILLGKQPHEFASKSVWAADSRYYIDGKSYSIPSKTFQEADTDAIAAILHNEETYNTYAVLKLLEVFWQVFVESVLNLRVPVIDREMAEQVVFEIVDGIEADEVDANGVMEMLQIHTKSKVTRICNNRNNIRLPGRYVLIQCGVLLCWKFGTELFNGRVILLFALSKVWIISSEQVCQIGYDTFSNHEVYDLFYRFHINQSF